MANIEELGRYIQKRIRDKNISDDDIAKALNISKKTVQKIFPLKDIYSERLSIFCILLDENIFNDFYGSKEPLKSILNSELISLKSKVHEQEDTIQLQKKYIAKLETELEALVSKKQKRS